MRARVFYHDGNVERIAHVSNVAELDDAFELTVPGHDRPLRYPKKGRGVAYVQAVWHDPD